VAIARKSSKVMNCNNYLKQYYMFTFAGRGCDAAVTVEKNENYRKKVYRVTMTANEFQIGTTRTMNV